MTAKVTDDELAAQVEAALTPGYGVAYVTRTKHGNLPAGTICRIKRTPASGLHVRVLVKDVGKKVARRYSQFLTNKSPVLKLEFAGPWYIVGHEDDKASYYDPF